MIYQLPILETFVRNKSVHALFIFPTKALAQDQKRSLLEWTSSVPELNNLKVYTLIYIYIYCITLYYIAQFAYLFI